MYITQTKNGGKTFKNMALHVVLCGMRSGEYRKVVNEYRELLACSMPGDKSIHATDLPALCFSALFGKRDKKVEFRSYNGLVLVEVLEASLSRPRGGRSAASSASSSNRGSNLRFG